MGFLSNLFGKKDDSPPFAMEPTAEMLDEDRYWALVADSIEQSGGDQECQANVLTGELEKLEPKDIVGFRLRTDKLLHDTYNSKMWCAVHSRTRPERIYTTSSTTTISPTAKANTSSSTSTGKKKTPNQ